MFSLKAFLYFVILLIISNATTVFGGNALKYQLLQPHNLLLSPKTTDVKQEVNEVLCEMQNNLTQSSLMFSDASGKIPAGILAGNLNHFGHSEQCLAIDETVEEVNIRGKYCMMSLNILITDDFVIPSGLSRVLPSGMSMNGMFAVCVPDACPPSVDNFLPGMEITSEELYCRTAGDRPIAAQDIVAIVLFSILGLLAITSTCYQLYNKILYQKDVTKIVKIFSAYHQLDKLTTYSTNVNPLSCINGIRTISTLWVILGHTYTAALYSAIINPLTFWEFAGTFNATWISAAPLAVDTFFFMAGFLLTVSLLKKFKNQVNYAKSIPFIYLARYLRLTPLMAAIMLLQVSLFNHVSTANQAVARCLEGWWVNLLYVQNYLRPNTTCLPHSWYLAYDMQLNLAAVIVIVFLFGRMKFATCALTLSSITALVAVLVNHYVRNTTEFGLMQEPTTDTFWDILFHNTTSCTAQFLFGIVVAYVVSQLKKRNISFTNKLYMTAHWVITAALLILPFYGVYTTNVYDLSQDTLNFFNAWHKPAWVLGVGGVIVACVHGFGGPVQWFLGHRMWIIPARLCYAMYLIHYPIMFAIVASFAHPFSFSNGGMFDRFVSDLGLTIIASIVLYVVVEAPFADLCTMLIVKISGQKKVDERKLAPNEDNQSPSSVNIVKDKQDQ